MYDETSALNSAKREGKEEGLKEGELKATYNLARKSIAEGLSISLISKLTGLSEEEIKRL